MSKTIFPRAVLFDLLTALLDSWTVWNSVAGSEAAGGDVARRVSASDLRMRAYVPYEQLVRTAARTAGLPDAAADTLDERWVELAAWSGAQEALDALQAEPSCGGHQLFGTIGHAGRRAIEHPLGLRRDGRGGRLLQTRSTSLSPCARQDRRTGSRSRVRRRLRLRLVRRARRGSAEPIGIIASGSRRPDRAPPANFESPTLDQLIPWLEGRLP